jgi:hypothetical protein
MTCLERLFTLKSVQALVDLLVGPEADSRKETESSERPQSKKA